MQYSSFIGDHIPCRYKSIIEDSSLKQLLFASNDRPKIKPEFIAEFRNWAVSNGKGKPTPVNDDDIKPNSKRRRSVDEEPKRLTMKDVFTLTNKGGKFTRVFRGWRVCSLIHDKPILYGLPDDPKARHRRSNSLYLSSYDDYPQFITKSAKSTNFHSAISFKSSTPNLAKLRQKSATKVKSCHVTSAGLNDTPISRTRVLVDHMVRPASSGQVPERREEFVCPSTSASDRNSAGDETSDVEILHADDTDCHVKSYREGYTYRKLNEHRPRSGITTASNVTTRSCPSATQVKPNLVCIDGSPTCHGIAPPTATRRPNNTVGNGERDKCYRGNQTDYVIQDVELHVEEKIPMKWQLNHRIRDLCDPCLTVNKPSPTEVTILCRTPQVTHKSSPSIPSNTNGKFGGKSKDKPYPFQLHISAARCSVKPNSKKAARSVLNFI